MKAKTIARIQKQWKEISAFLRKRGKEVGIMTEEDVNRIVYEIRHPGRKRQSKSGKRSKSVP